MNYTFPNNTGEYGLPEDLKLKDISIFDVMLVAFTDEPPCPLLISELGYVRGPTLYSLRGTDPQGYEQSFDADQIIKRLAKGEDIRSKIFDSL